MDNLLLICPFCKKPLNKPKDYQVAWCIYCRAEEDNGNNDWSLFQAYFDKNNNIFDIIIWFDEFCLNASFGNDGLNYAPPHSIYIKRNNEFLLELAAKLDYKPDADYLESKMKLWLTFS